MCHPHPGWRPTAAEQTQSEPQGIRSRRGILCQWSRSHCWSIWAINGYWLLSLTIPVRSISSTWIGHWDASRIRSRRGRGIWHLRHEAEPDAYLAHVIPAEGERSTGVRRASEKGLCDLVLNLWHVDLAGAVALGAGRFVAHSGSPNDRAYDLQHAAAAASFVSAAQTARWRSARWFSGSG